MKIPKQAWLAAYLITCSVNANSDVEKELAVLKTQLDLLQKKMAKLEQQLAHEKNNKPLNDVSPILEPTKTIKSSPVVAAQRSKNDLKFYTTLRPTFGYIDENGETTLDVRDALSHTGIKSTTEFLNDWQAILHAEWGIDLSDNGDFGKARQVYVALDSPYGRLGIGKQRPAQYLFIAEYVDLFNHSSSPFAYDPESLFFVNNLLTYQKQLGNYTFMVVGQFDGENGDNYQDLINTGVSYDEGDLHLALTYTTQDALENDLVIGNDDIIGASIAYQFNPEFYFALGYQDKEYQRDRSNDRSGHTLDLSMAYQFHDNYKVKFGIFDFDDGYSDAQSNEYYGLNATFEWLPANHLRFHLEYLKRDFEYKADFESISIGFRYDYSQLWTF